MSKYMNLMGQNARKASLKKINTKIKNNVLKKYIFLLDKEKKSILRANVKDIKVAIKKKLKINLIDRLTINHVKLNDIIKKIDDVYFEFSTWNKKIILRGIAKDNYYLKKTLNYVLKNIIHDKLPKSWHL